MPKPNLLIADDEPAVLNGASNIAGTSAKLSETPIPLPPAAWTGLSGLLGLGIAGLARSFRRIIR